MRRYESHSLDRFVRLWCHPEAGRLRPTAAVLVVSLMRRVRVRPTVGRAHVCQFNVRARRVLLPELRLPAVVAAAVGRRRPAVRAAAVRLLRPAVVVVRPAHEQELRQVVQEDDTHPLGHAVRARRAEVPVDDDDRDEDREDVHDEREQQVLSDQRDADGRRREDLRDEQEEHDQGE